MDKYLYVEILRETLLPFIRQVYPNSHRFMADNDPKHTSKFAQTFVHLYRYTTINLNHDLPESDIIEESISTQTLESLLLLPVSEACFSGSSFCTYCEWVF